MKTVKSKLHHHRKARKMSHGPAPIPQDAAELWAMDHDMPDADQMLYRVQRSPKQENL